MRLLDTKTGMFVEKNPIETTYAILSHTWDIKGEQTYQDLRKIQERYALKDQPRSGAPRNGSCSSPPLSELEPSPIPSPSSYPSSKQKHTVPLSPTDIDSMLSILHVCPKTSHDYTIIPVPTRRTLWEDPELSPKIRQACKVARSNGFRYIWIDSCCIDKSSSSELSEAINSMYSWYMRANVCYAYLVDVPAGVDHRNMASLFRKSRWFRRGWTLQELIAPPNVMFVSEDWTIIGTKWAFADLVQEITGISVEALLQLESLDRFSVAQRLSWASGRETTRVEDQAYSLLGLFDINMSTLYGEGSRAFRRLQEEIMRRIPDQSLFAWGEVYLGSPMLPTEASTTGPGKKPLNAAVVESMPSQRSFSLRSLKLLMPSSPLAEAPSYFSNCRSIDTASFGSTSHVVIRGTQLKYTFSPYGIRTQFPMIPLSLLFPKDEPQNGVQDMSHCQWYVAILGCEHAERPGYLLGRVCCTLPCHSGVELLSYASAPIEWMNANFEVIPLSPEAIEHCRPHIEQKTVYISHPNRDDPLTELGANCDQPHQNINLLLLRKTCTALRSQGYTTVELRAPSHNRRRASHWLTLSNDGHTITIEFRHDLYSYGKKQQLLVTAIVELSRLHPGPSVNSRAQVHEENPREVVSWVGCMPWQTLCEESVTFDRTRTGEPDLTVDLALVFAATDVYMVDIKVHR